MPLGPRHLQRTSNNHQNNNSNQCCNNCSLNTNTRTLSGYSLTGHYFIDGLIYLIAGIALITGMIVYAFSFKVKGTNWLYIIISILIFTSFCIFPGIKILLHGFGLIPDLESIRRSQHRQRVAALRDQLRNGSSRNREIVETIAGNVNFGYSEEPPTFEQVLANEMEKSSSHGDSKEIEELPGYDQISLRSQPISYVELNVENLPDYQQSQTKLESEIV